MHRRVLQATSTSSNPTLSCDPTSSSNNGTSNACQSTVPDSSSTGFASTALWAVVLSILGSIALLSLTLFCLKRRVRVRARQRVRAALWDMVRGVGDGTVDESALRRLVNAEFGEEKAPILHEVQLSFDDAPLLDNNAKGDKAINDEKKVSTKEHDKALPLWKWKDLRPLAVTHPYPLSNDAKDAYPKIKVDRPALLRLSSSSTTKPTEKITDAPHNPLKASSSRIERRIDSVIMIAMPHPDRPWHLPVTHPIDSSNIVNVVDVPIKLGASSTTFLEDLYDQIVPPPTRMKEGNEEALSGALSSSRAGVSAANASMVGRMEAEERVRRQQEDRRRGRWIDEGHDWFGLNDIRR